MLPHSSAKAATSSRTLLGGMCLALTLRSNRSQTCSMGLRSGLFAGHGRTLMGGPSEWPAERWDQSNKAYHQ
jgi:hypothetical protein